MARVNRFDAISFTNCINQEINVGDEVVGIAISNWTPVRVFKGTYTGCNIDDRGNVVSVRVDGRVKRNWRSRLSPDLCEMGATTLQNKLIFKVAP